MEDDQILGDALAIKLDININPPFLSGNGIKLRKISHHIIVVWDFLYKSIDIQFKKCGRFSY